MNVLLFSACKNSLEGDLTPNIPPETFTIVDTIIRLGDDRFNSQVEISWWANDPDGLVAGYEYTFDSIIDESSSWHFTTKQDSIFLLATPPGKDTIDFNFKVRAIDNLGAKDPTPATLVYPVKNSAPAVAFIDAENSPVITFPVIRFYWEGSDPDGYENLNHFECCWNDTTQLPYVIDISATGAVFEADDLLNNFPQCKVFLNNNSDAQPELMNGLALNDTNVLYIRAVDNALALSPFVASYKIYVKKPVSSILLVDGYTSGGSAVESFYTQHLISAGFPSVDTMQIFQQLNNAYTQLSPDNLSQSKLFALFKTIIWFSNDAVNSLSLGQRTLNDFFNNNGKLLMSVYVSSLFDEQSDFLDFTPIQSFIVPVDTTLLLTDTSKILSTAVGYPDLKSAYFLGVVRPFSLAVGATSLYDASLIAKDNSTLELSGWTGISTVMAKKSNGSGATNFIISTLELQKIDGLGNMNDFFHQVLINEFGL
ncbi:MAG: hypothetical protein IPO83_04915 [Chitinophagaceae bacterium]|nr:hypothetical protein [Chitinophagaceae bacterium]